MGRIITFLRDNWFQIAVLIGLAIVIVQLALVIDGLRDVTFEIDWLGRQS